MRGLQKRALATGRSGSSTKPVRAFVLIQTVPGKVAPLVGALERIKEVKGVDPVTGPYDVVVLLEVDELSDISAVVAGTIGGLKWVTRPTTGASFPRRAFPRAADASRQSQNELDLT